LTMLQGDILLPTVRCNNETPLMRHLCMGRGLWPWWLCAPVHRISTQWHFGVVSVSFRCRFGLLVLLAEDIAVCWLS